MGILDAVIFTLVGSLVGAFLGYWTNYIYQKRSAATVSEFGFIWRPGEPNSVQSFDVGDFVKLWFSLEGRTSPGDCSIELVYTPSSAQAGDDEVTVFAKWDEAPDPTDTSYHPSGAVERTFYGDRVPATYFLPLRLRRLYTVPVLWATPAAYMAVDDDREQSDIIKDKDEILLFSAWWFDPRRPRPYPVREVLRDGKLKVILTGDDLTWEREFLIEDLIEGAGVVRWADSDARQSQLKQILSAGHVWPENRSLWFRLVRAVGFRQAESSD